MAEEKLTHEEADRRILEAARPKKTAGTDILGKLRGMAGRRGLGNETTKPTGPEL